MCHCTMYKKYHHGCVIVYLCNVFCAMCSRMDNVQCSIWDNECGGVLEHSNSYSWSYPHPPPPPFPLLQTRFTFQLLKSKYPDFTVVNCRLITFCPQFYAITLPCRCHLISAANLPILVLRIFALIWTLGTFFKLWWCWSTLLLQTTRLFNFAI